MPKNESFEYVAKALCASCGELWKPPELDKFNNHWRNKVETVIRTMRNMPSGRMAEAGADAVRPYAVTKDEFSGAVEVALDCWQEMCDALLEVV